MLDRLQQSKKAAETYPDKGSDQFLQFNQYVSEFGVNVVQSLLRQYVEKDMSNPVLRLSGIGKTPVFELLGKKLGLLQQNQSENLSENHKLIFSLGDYLESWLMFTLRRLGYKILGTQGELDFMGVSGHYDFLIEDDNGSPLLIECKSANDYYFTSVSKYGVNDDRGYLTQLLLYSHCLNDVPACWVFINKNTAEIKVIPLDSINEDYRNARFKRAVNVVKLFNKVNSVEELYTQARPYPASIEKDKHGTPILDDNGNIKLYAPANVSHPNFMYSLVEGRTKYNKKRFYVTDYNYPQEYQQFKPDVKEDALRYDGQI